MPSGLLDFLPFILLPVGILGALVLIRRRGRAQAELLRGVAAAEGLEFDDAAPGWILPGHPPELRGVLRQKRVQVHLCHTGSGKSRRTWTAVEVEPRQTSSFVFKLTPQGVGSKLKSWFGAQDILVRDTSFDRDWFIESNRPEFLAAAILPEIRQRMADLRHVAGGRGHYDYRHGRVRYVEAGGYDAARIARLSRALGICLDLADLVEVEAVRP